LKSLLTVVHRAKSGILGEKMSISATCLHVALLFIAVRSYSVTFQISFRGDCSTYSCVFSVFIGGVSSGSSYATFLDHPQHPLLMKKKNQLFLLLFVPGK